MPFYDYATLKNMHQTEITAGETATASVDGLICGIIPITDNVTVDIDGSTTVPTNKFTWKSGDHEFTKDVWYPFFATKITNKSGSAGNLLVISESGVEVS